MVIGYISVTQNLAHNYQIRNNAQVRTLQRMTEPVFTQHTTVPPPAQKVTWSKNGLKDSKSGSRTKNPSRRTRNTRLPTSEIDQKTHQTGTKGYKKINLEALKST
jgi:hypothetical protein